MNAGSSSGLDLAQAEAQRRGVAASLPLAEADLVREEQRLAVLTAWPIETLRANTVARDDDSRRCRSSWRPARPRTG